MSDNTEVIGLLKKYKITAPAVDIYHIIKENGIHLVFEKMDDSDSGFLLIEQGRPTIAINALHHPNRQRFTAAHECGHYFLHRDGGENQLFVDQSFQRDARASTGTNEQEIQANNFAAQLLMPESFLLNAVMQRPLSDLDIALLALKFEVSEQAMTLRLVKLGIVEL